MNDENRVERPIAQVLVPVRDLVRWTRLQGHRIRSHGRVHCGQRFAIGGRSKILSPDFFSCGDNVAIGSDFHCEANVQAGDDIVISSKVSFVGNDHDLSSGSFFSSKRLPPATVVLEGNNFVGHGTIIIGPVTLGRGAVVGAGSVVVSDIPSYVVAVGVPCKPVSQRPRNIDVS